MLNGTPPELGWLTDPDLGGERVAALLQCTFQFNVTGQPVVGMPGSVGGPAGELSAPVPSSAGGAVFMSSIGSGGAPALVVPSERAGLSPSASGFTNGCSTLELDSPSGSEGSGTALLYPPLGPANTASTTGRRFTGPSPTWGVIPQRGAPTAHFGNRPPRRVEGGGRSRLCHGPAELRGKELNAWP